MSQGGKSLITPQTSLSQRDILRTQDSTNPEITLKDEQIQRKNYRNNREEWRNKLTLCSIKRRPMSLWRVPWRLSGKRALTATNQPKTFSINSFSDKNKIATHFTRQFTRPTPHRPNTATRRTMRLIRKKHKLNPSATTFTTDEISAALNASGNSTTPSPVSYAHERLPPIWKHAILLPLLKPGRPKEQGASNWPISLLCPVSKLLETLKLPLITPHIHLADIQHGFRAGHSTTTVLLLLANQIAPGLYQNCPPRHIVAMAVDFSKAFGTVSQTALIRSLLNSTIEYGSQHCQMAVHLPPW